MLIVVSNNAKNAGIAPPSDYCGFSWPILSLYVPGVLSVVSAVSLWPEVHHFPERTKTVLTLLINSEVGDRGFEFRSNSCGVSRHEELT